MPYNKTTIVYQILFVFLIIIVTSFIYFPSLNSPVFFDSMSSINERHLNEISSSYTPSKILQKRFLTWFTLIQIKNLFGFNIKYFRLTNLLIHIMNSVLILLLLLELYKTKTIPSLNFYLKSFLATLLFALNPVAVYSTAYTIQISILLCTFFSLLCLLSFCFGIEKKNIFLLILSSFFYFLALSAKEVAIMLPAVLFLIFFIKNKTNKLSLKSIWFPFTLYGLIALHFIFGSSSIIGTTYEPWAGSMQNKAHPDALNAFIPQNLKSDFTWLKSALNQTMLFFRYIFLWLIPLPHYIAIDIPLTFPSSIFSIKLILSVVLFILYSIGGFALALKKNLWSLVILFPAFMFMTEFSVIRFHEIFVLYRSYLWMIFLPLTFLLLLKYFSSFMTLPFTFTLCLIFSFLTQERLQTFKDPISLWTDATQKIDLKNTQNTAAYRSFVFLGGHYSSQGQNQKAALALEQSLAFNKQSYLTYYNLGIIYSDLKKPQKAKESLLKAVKLAPKDVSVLYNLANLYLKQKDFKQAIFYYDKAFEINPQDANIAHNMAIAYFQNKNYNKALQYYQKAIQLKPYFDKAYYNYANALMITGHPQKAILNYTKSIQLNPKYKMAWYNRGVAHSKMNQDKKAFSDINQTLKLDPQFQPALRFLNKLKSKIANTLTQD